MVRKKSFVLTEGNTKRYFFRNLFFGFILISFLFNHLISAIKAEELFDRAVAVVGSEVLTYREVEKRYILYKISEGFSVNLYSKELTSKEFEQARMYAIKVTLVKNHMKKIALQSPPFTKEISAKISAVKKYVGGNDKYLKFLKFYEMDDVEVETLIKQTLFTQHFFERTARVGAKVSDEEVLEYYQKEKDNKFYKRDFKDIEKHIRKFLEKKKVEQKIEDWVKTQSEQTKIKLIG